MPSMSGGVGRATGASRAGSSTTAVALSVRLAALVLASHRQVNFVAPLDLLRVDHLSTYPGHIAW